MFKPACTTKTSIINRSFDEMGNLLWQQEAAEFVERYPQRRRPQTAALLLRQSASAGTLYRKPVMENTMPILNKRASGGELLTPQHRHQRDLFSGDLGIPDVNSHVGSMVHTFENMALHKQMAAKQREQRAQEHSKYLEDLLTLKVTAQNQEAIVDSVATTTTTTTKRTFIPSSSASGTTSKFQQLKKKTHETRQKIIQQLMQQHQQQTHQQPAEVTKPLHQTRPTPSHEHGFSQALTNSEVYYRNIDEDYRKNLFGSLNNRKIKPVSLGTTGPNDVETSSFCDEIVTQAFDEIFESYSGLDDEEEPIQQNSLNLVTDLSYKTPYLDQYARPGVTPKKLPFSIANKKNPAPQPPPLNHRKSNIQASLKETKQKSSTLHNLFERLKTPPRRTSNPYTLNNMAQDSLLQADCPVQQLLPKFPKNLHFKREVEGQEEDQENLEQDFLRGSTVSQSFVKQVKMQRPQKGKAPPAPTETQSTKKALKTSEALRQVLLFSKRSKSTADLLPVDTFEPETRKYYRRLNDESLVAPRHPERKLADGCSFVGDTAQHIIQQQEEI